MVRQFLSTLETPHLEDGPISRAMRIVVTRVNELLTVPLVKGELLRDVSVGVAVESTFHRLGRVPVGFLVVASDTPVKVAGSPLDFKKDSITLVADVPATVSLWVF